MHPNPVHLPPYPMPSVISAMAPLLGLLALFFLIAVRYAAALNLWGDEAYTLNVAAKSVGEFLAADPFHLPTYYLLLHPIVGFPPRQRVAPAADPCLDLQHRAWLLLAHWPVLAGPWLGALVGDDSHNSASKLYLLRHEHPHVCVAVCGLPGVAVNRFPPADARRR